MKNKFPDIDFQDVENLTFECYQKELINHNERIQTLVSLNIARLCIENPDFPYYLKQLLLKDSHAIHNNLKAHLFNNTRTAQYETSNYAPEILKVLPWNPKLDKDKK